MEWGFLRRKKTKWWAAQPGVVRAPLPLQWARFVREGDGSFQVVWPTDLERVQNCAELLVYLLPAMPAGMKGSSEGPPFLPLMGQLSTPGEV